MTEKGSFWKNNIKKLLEEKLLEEKRLEERLLEKQLEEKQLKEKQLKEKKARRKEEAKKKAKEAKEKKAIRKEEAKKKAKEAKEKKARRKEEAKKKAKEAKEKKARRKEEAEKKAKEKKARRKEEAKKKAKEVKEKKARRKEEAKKEQKAMWRRLQEPPVECCKLLLDTNIIKDIWNIPQARDRLRNYLKKKPFWGIGLFYLTLDRVIDEFIDERTRRTFGAEDQDYDDVCRNLSSLGTFQDFELMTRAEYARRAEELHDKKIYIGNGGIPLSLVDCYLLEYAIEYSCKLVTHDKGLINATKKEIRLRSGESESTEGTSPGVFNPYRT